MPPISTDTTTRVSPFDLLQIKGATSATPHEDVFERHFDRARQAPSSDDTKPAVNSATAPPTEHNADNATDAAPASDEPVGGAEGSANDSQTEHSDDVLAAQAAAPADEEHDDDFDDLQQGTDVVEISAQAVTVAEQLPVDAETNPLEQSGTIESLDEAIAAAVPAMDPSALKQQPKQQQLAGDAASKPEKAAAQAGDALDVVVADQPLVEEAVAVEVAQPAIDAPAKTVESILPAVESHDEPEHVERANKEKSADAAKNPAPSATDAPTAKPVPTATVLNVEPVVCYEADTPLAAEGSVRPVTAKETTSRPRRGEGKSETIAANGKEVAKNSAADAAQSTAVPSVPVAPVVETVSMEPRISEMVSTMVSDALAPNPGAEVKNDVDASPRTTMVDAIDAKRAEDRSAGPKQTVHGAGAEARETVSTTDRARFAQRVARALQSAQQRGGEIRLRLSPPELGSLRMEITVERGALTARLEAETPAARSVLLENLPMLRERLAEQDIRIARFEVEVNDQRRNSAEQPSDGGQQQGSHQPRRRTPEQREAAPRPLPIRTAAAAGNGALDVVI